VIMDSGLKSDSYVSFIATDNFRGGQLGAEHLGKLLGGKGNVILMRYQVGSASTEEREAGFLDALKKHPDIKLISSDQYAGPTRETGYQAAQNLLNRFGNDVNGIFCPNESTAFAMLRVLQDNGWAGKVHFVGFDASENLVNGLASGQIDALVVQDPINMGYLGLKTLVAHIKGQPVEKRIDTGVRLITRDRMDDADARELLHPDLSKWLKP